jgi:hypothetical protein
MLQTILIPKKHFSLPGAIKWLIDHNYSHCKVDTTDKFYRFRQREPQGGHYYTITLANGIELVNETHSSLH